MASIYYVCVQLINNNSICISPESVDAEVLVASALSEQMGLEVSLDPFYNL